MNKDTNESGEIDPDNKLGLKTFQEINEAEAVGVNNGYDFIFSLDYDEKIDPYLIKDIHYHTFSHLYHWAGQYRTTNPTVGAFQPPPYQEVPQLLPQYTERLNYFVAKANEHRNRNQIIHALAFGHYELIYIHPFPNGNGRTARLLTDLISFQFGYGFITLYEREQTNQRRKYINALEEIRKNLNYKPFEEMIEESIKRFE